MNRNNSIKIRLLKQDFLLPSAGILAMIILTILSCPIPFFWDTTFFAGGAMHFTDKGLTGLVLPLNIDSGGFPLYSLWMAMGWTLFGKTLTASHFIMLPFLAGIVHEYYRLSRRFLNAHMLKWAMILLLLEPTFITQGMLMAYDLMLLYFFLFSLNSLLTGNKVLFSIGTAFLVLCSVRGMISLAALGIIHGLWVALFKERPFRSGGIFLYILPLFMWAAWAIWHNFHTGWMFFSPERESSHEALVGSGMMFRQCIYILWKAADFGRIILFIILGLSVMISLRKKLFSKEFKKLLLIVFVPLLVCIGVMSPLANPIGQRYFLTTIAVLPIVTLFCIGSFTGKGIRSILILISALALFSGNFWIYPERFGNGWDASLKVIPWFRMEGRIFDYVRENRISPEQIGTLWPVYTEPGTSLPGNVYKGYADLTDKTLAVFPYILQSNICNYFRPDEIDLLRKHWIVAKEWRSGQVYAVLYKNPEH